MAKSPLELIHEIRAKAEAEIAKLTEAAVSDLRARASALEQELAGIYQEIERITGKSAGGTTRKRKGGGVGSSGGKTTLPDVPSPAALRSLLNKADGKKLNRKGFIDAGYNLKSAILLAKEDEKTFGFKQNAAQGEVWLK